MKESSGFFVVEGVNLATPYGPRKVVKRRTAPVPGVSSSSPPIWHPTGGEEKGGSGRSCVEPNGADPAALLFRARETNRFYPLYTAKKKGVVVADLTDTERGNLILIDPRTIVISSVSPLFTYTIHRG